MTYSRMPSLLSHAPLHHRRAAEAHDLQMYQATCRETILVCTQTCRPGIMRVLILYYQACQLEDVRLCPALRLVRDRSTSSMNQLDQIPQAVALKLQTSGGAPHLEVDPKLPVQHRRHHSTMAPHPVAVASGEVTTSTTDWTQTELAI